MNRSSNPVDELWTCWEQRRYMAALTAAWRLPSLYNYPIIVSRNSGLSLQRLVFRACQQAFASALRSNEEHQPTLLWVDELLGQFPPPPALIDHGDGSDAETYREQMIRATLTCVRLALTEHWTSPLRFSPALSQVAEDNDLPLGLLQDCVVAWMSQSVEGSSWRQPQQSIALNALLVEETRGVVATLTLDLLENGTGSWYPSPELAFVRRDAAFRQTEKQVWLSAGPLSARYDLRWRLRRRDGQPITALTGSSMGLVFTLGIAKLLTTDLQTVELEAVGGTAAVDADGALYKVGGLWKKLGDQAIDTARRDLLRIVVVASEQDDVPLEYLNEETGPLRILKATTIHDAIGQLQEQFLPRRTIRQYESEQCQRLQILDKAVSISRHYQALPLLRTVKRERLLRARTERARDKPQTREEWLKGLRNVDIVRWEEALREEQVSYAPVSLEQILQGFQGTQNQADSGLPRFVVLGPPGCGKTTFTQYLAWRAARNDLVIHGHSLIPARIRLHEWETWFTQTTAPEHSLATYLATRYQDLPKAPTAEHWRRWLQRGEVLLLLDGLDEIEQKPTFLSALKVILTLFKTCPTVITCRTVSFDQHQSLCPDFAVFTLAGLDETQQETFIRAFPANAPDSYDPEALLGQLHATLTLRPLAANPLLLSIMCYVADHAKSPLLPATRGELYRKALETLLTHTRQRVDVRYPGEKPAIEEKLVIVQRAALYLFLREEQRLTFTGEELRQAFRRALIEEGYAEEAVAPWVNTFRTDFTQNSGILRGNTDQGFFFLHLTVHEFLAAAAIAHLVNDKGWDAVTELSDEHVDLLGLVERKAWDPRWQEVITFLAGQLADPLPLLTLLTQEKRDDVFRHRLALATRCLPELRLSSAKNLTDMVNRVTTAAFSFWSRHERQGTEATVPHFTRVFPALVQVNGSVEGTPLLQRLARQLQEKKEDVRIGAMRAVGLAGESVVQHPDILNAVAAALRDADEMVRAEAAAALKQIGKAATISPEVLVSLTQVVQHDSSWFVRSAAAQALRKLQGKGGAPTETDNFQTSALSEEDTGLTPIPHQLKNSGAQGGTSEDTLSQFTSLLFSEDPTARAHAAYALGQRKEQVAQYPETVSALVQVALHDQDSGVRGQALDALARIGKEAESALRGQACLALVHAVQQDKESGIRARAARALRAIVSREVPGVEVCSTLLPALGDPDVNVRAEVAAVLGEIMAHGVRLFRRWWRKVEVKNVEELSTV